MNEHLLSEGRESATRASIVSVIKRCKPKITKVIKQKQGSSDVTSAWARARWMQTRQFLIRLGDIDETTSFIGPVEKRWDRDSLGHLSLDQIAWWDETHRKCLIGGIPGNKEFTLHFKRNKEGLLDEKGKYSDKKLIKLNVKYENEGRFGLGCARVVKNNSNLPSTVVMKPFDYSGKTIISVDDYEKKKILEFRRIKSLSTKSILWYVKQTNGKIHQSDALDKLPGIAKKGKEQMKEAGILTLGDLCDISSEALDSVEGMSKKKCKNLKS